MMHQLVKEGCYDWSDRIVVSIFHLSEMSNASEAQITASVCLSVCLDSNPQAAPNRGPQARPDSSVGGRTVGKADCMRSLIVLASYFQVHLNHQDVAVRDQHYSLYRKQRHMFCLKGTSLTMNLCFTVHYCFMYEIPRTCDQYFQCIFYVQCF